MTTDDDGLDRPIWGGTAIAREIGRSLNATYDLIYRGELPVRRVGKRYCTTRRRLREFFNETPVAA